MKKNVLDFIWNYKLLLTNNFNKRLISLIVIGTLFIAYLLTYPIFFSSLKEKSEPLQNIDLIGVWIYIFILIVGISYNFRNLNSNFLKKLGAGIAISFGRAFLVMMIELALLFIVKFIAIAFFKITPMYFNDLNSFADIIWYYPVLQLPLFFYEYKKTQDDKKQFVVS